MRYDQVCRWREALYNAEERLSDREGDFGSYQAYHAAIYLADRILFHSSLREEDQDKQLMRDDYDALHIISLRLEFMK